MVRATVPLPTGVAWAVTARPIARPGPRAQDETPGTRRQPVETQRRMSTVSRPGAAWLAAAVAHSPPWRVPPQVPTGCVPVVAAGAQTPRENMRRPCFSCTTQWPPADFTRRVSPASPGGNRAHPAGTASKRPSAVRTVRESVREQPSARHPCTDFLVCMDHGPARSSGRWLEQFQTLDRLPLADAAHGHEGSQLFLRGRVLPASQL